MANGDFTSEGYDPDRHHFVADGTDVGYTYEIESWKPVDGELQFGELDEDDFQRVDYAVFRIEREDTGEVFFETIEGKWESWEFVNDILEYDFGGEGSR